MARLVALFAFAAVALFAATAGAAGPLVDTAWLKANLDTPGLVVLDVRSRLDGHSEADFQQAHIPGAVYSDYLKAGWRVTDDNGTVGMLAPVDSLETLIGGLGIDNDSHVVVVPAGRTALDIGSATRVYWTFKVLGHDNVSLLDGGMAAWTADEANPVEAGAAAPQPKTFAAAFRPEMIASKDDVLKAIDAGTATVDNRPHSQHMGITRHPKAARSGTIPGSKNLPENWLTQGGGGKFRSAEQLGKLYAAVGLSPEDDHITYCNTAHWASLGWFASSEILGNKSVRMYDGSMVEWSGDDKLEIERKISLE